MSRLQLTYFIALFCTCSALTNQKGHNPQMFSFHTKTHCEGEARHLTESNLDIPGSGDDILNHTQSWFPNGVWLVTFSNEHAVLYINKYGLGACKTCEEGRTAPFLSVEKIHPYDFDDEAFLVSLNYQFMEPRHYIPPGVGWVIYDPPINVTSWLFTGNYSYAIYKGQNRDEPALCIEPDSATKERGYGIEWGTSYGFEVGAIQRVGECPRNVTKLNVEEKTKMVYAFDRNGNEVKDPSGPC